MRVLMVSSGLHAASGGTATAAVEMAVAAKKSDKENQIKITLAFPYDPVRLDEIRENLNILKINKIDLIMRKLLPLGPKRKLPKRWGISFSLAWAIWRKAKDFDIIHANSPYAFSTIAALLAAKRHKIPFILSPHEGLTRFDRSKASQHFLIKLKNSLVKLYRRHANGLIFASELEWLDSGYPIPYVATKHDDRPHDKPHDKPLAKPFLLAFSVAIPNLQRMVTPIDSNDPIRVGYLGRIDPKKNIHILISAMSLAVNRQKANLKLYVAGGGNLHLLRQLQSQAGHHNLQKHVRWLGFVNQSERAKFLSEIEILVVPSVYESFGLVAAEAMAAGVPVIVSPTVGVAEDVSRYHAGLVIPPRPDALAVALNRLNRADLADWGRAARQLVVENYHQNVIGARLIAIYQQMVRE